MTPLLVLRHGPTDWNAAARIQGRADRPLSEAGRVHVRSWRLPAGWEDAACVSSLLRRAVETASLLGYRASLEPRLIEMDWGEWEGRSLSELRDELGDAMADNERRGLDFRPPGGESPRDVQERLRPWLADLAGPTIAVTHKGVLRALYALATGWSMQDKAADKLRGECAHAFVVTAAGVVTVGELNIPLRGAT